MSQVNAPREYKFVSGYPRKRRRRTAPRNATTSSMTCQGAAACSVDKGQAQSASIRPPPATSQSQLRSEQVAVQPNSDETINNAASGILLSSPAAVDVDIGTFNEDTNWPYDSLVNPHDIPDPVTRFPTPFDQFVFLGPGDEPWDRLIYPLSNDGLSNRGGGAADEGEYAAVIENETEDFSTLQTLDETVLPSLGLNSTPCNMTRSHTITQLFSRYEFYPHDQEFCVMPLTHDFAANPFRFNVETSRCSQLLRHCILALSYKHVSRDTGACWDESKMHRGKALQMLKGLEGDSHTSRLEADLLDALLILMTLDCATSAHGPWAWYLKRAHKIIQATESLAAHRSLRMQAGIEMLVWWDVTLALTSRQGCILSESVIMSVVNSARTDNRTFYSVSGCPEALFRHMVRLGSYARELELTSTMICAKFDTDPVLALEKSIRDWTDPEYDELDDRRSGYLCTEVDEIGHMLHYKEDLHHCAEAWRYGLLLYIERVFKWQRNQPPSPILGFLARKTLNHMTSCRRSTMVQKQLLLPVLLAGCETKDENLRQEARQYCSWWNEKTRYDMFLTALGLLEKVWANNGNNPQAWWGSIMDQKSRDDVNAPDFRQYLFG